jgi:integrase
VERYYADLVDVKKLAPNSLIAHAAVLSSALRAAVKARKLRENVAQLAENRPRRSHAKGDVLNNVWTAEQAQRFLETLKAAGNTQCTALFALALDSGCRRNELLGLQWRHLDGRTLRIEQQIVQGGQFAAPKRGSVRSVDLSDETVGLLAQHKREQTEVKMANRTSYTDNELIFAQAWDSSSARHAVLGAPLYRASVNKRLDALCKTAAAPHHRPRTSTHMRDTAACSRCAGARGAAQVGSQEHPNHT